MTEADRIVLEDTILKMAFGRRGYVTRMLANGPLQDAGAKEALNYSRQTVDEILKEFNVYKKPGITIETPSGTIEIG